MSLARYQGWEWSTFESTWVHSKYFLMITVWVQVWVPPWNSMYNQYKYSYWKLNQMKKKSYNSAIVHECCWYVHAVRLDSTVPDEELTSCKVIPCPEIAALVDDNPSTSQWIEKSASWTVELRFRTNDCSGRHGLCTAIMYIVINVYSLCSGRHGPLANNSQLTVTWSTTDLMKH